MRIRYGHKKVLSRPSRARWEIMLEWMLDEFERTAGKDGYELDWGTLEIGTRQSIYDESTFVSPQTTLMVELDMHIEGEGAKR